MRTFERFNESAFSHFINSPAGRAFRVAVGIGLFVVGYVFRAHWLGIVAIVLSAIPLTAGGFDVCYVSGLLGGPLMGPKIRQRFGHRMPNMRLGHKT